MAQRFVCDVCNEIQPKSVGASACIDVCNASSFNSNRSPSAQLPEGGRELCEPCTVKLYRFLVLNKDVA